MKISVLGLRGIPQVMGGVETHCEQLYPRIVSENRSDFSVCIIARRSYVDSSIRSYRNISIYPTWNSRSPYFEAILHTAAGLLHSRFALRTDVVHIHAVGPGLTIPFAKLLGLKVVFTHHGEDYRRAKWNRFARVALQLGEELALAFSDRIIVVSRSLAEHLAERKPVHAHKIVHIPNGASIAPADASPGNGDDALARFGLEPGRYVMTVGRLVPEKGIHDLIDAFEMSGSSDKLVIVGAAQMATPYADGLLARASERVIFTGELKRHDIDPLYRSARLFVLASSHEGLPIAALEALATGIRVLLSDIAPNRDLDLDPGNYFAVGNVDELALRLADPDSIPLANSNDYRRRYNWDAIAETTADVFREVGGMRPPHAPDTPKEVSGNRVDHKTANASASLDRSGHSC